MGGNPVSFKDPSGLIAGVDDAIIVGGIVVTAGCMATPGCREAIGNIGKAIANGISDAADAIGEICTPANDEEKKPSRRPTKGVKDEADKAATDSNGNLICTYCGVVMDPNSGQGNSREYDHKDPWVDTHDSSRGNITDACRTCNRGKGLKSLEDFLGIR